MNNQPIMQHLQQARNYKQELHDKIEQWIREYDGEPYGNETEGRSRIVWKLIKKHGEILIANLVKPFITGSNIINLVPRTKNDVIKSKLDNKLLNFFFNKEFDKTQFLKTMCRVMVKEGTAIAKVSWIKNKKENKPFIEVLYNEDIFTDPDAKNIQECKYIIHRFRTTPDELDNNIDYNKQAIEKFRKSFEKDDDEEDTSALGDDLHDKPSGSFSDEMYIYEYWYKKDNKVKIISFLNNGDEVFTLMEEDFEFNWYPFVATPFYDNEFSIWGRGLTDIISDEQKFMTSIVRGVIDNISMSNNGTKFIKKGALDSINLQRLMKGEPVVEINATDNVSMSVKDGSFNELPSMVYNLLQVIESQAEGLTGVSKMMQGLQEVNSASATAAQLVMTQSQIRLLDIENSIVRGLTRVFKMWLDMILKYVTEKQMLNITGTTFNEEKVRMIAQLKEKYQVEQLPPDTQQKAILLIMQEVEKVFNNTEPVYDINIQIGTDGLKQTKINQINMLMQQSSALVQAGAVPPTIIQKLMANLFELFDYPELADETRNYKQQPDPLQQQMAQLELQQKQADVAKTEALAKNSIARTQMTAVKAQKEQASTEPDTAKKYAELTQQLKEINGEQNNKNEKTNK